MNHILITTKYYKHVQLRNNSYHNQNHNLSLRKIIRKINNYIHRHYYKKEITNKEIIYKKNCNNKINNLN